MPKFDSRFVPDPEKEEFTFDSRFFPDPEKEEIVDSRVLLSGDKCTLHVEASEALRVVVFRAKPPFKSSVRFVRFEGDCKGGWL